MTWNVNGLRAALRRSDMTLGVFLSSLDSGESGKSCWVYLLTCLLPWLKDIRSRFIVADIICFQETKLTRNEFLLERDLSLANGWCGPSYLVEAGLRM